MEKKTDLHSSADTCDECGKQFKPDDDVVLLPKRGTFHQDCYLRSRAQPQTSCKPGEKA